MGPGEQYLDVIYHAEPGLDEHIDTIYRENDMDPVTGHAIPDSWRDAPDVERAGVWGRNVPMGAVAQADSS